MKYMSKIAAVLLMAFSVAVQAQQTRSGTENDSQQSNSRNWIGIADFDENVYVDLNSVQKRNKKAVFDILNNYEKPKTTSSGLKYHSVVTSWQFDCKNQLARSINMSIYNEEMGKGASHQGRVSDEFSPFDQNNPKTEVDTIAYFACGKPGNYDYMSQDSHPKLFKMCDHRELTTVSKDSVNSMSKRLRTEIVLNNQINPDQEKYNRYTLEAKKSGFKLIFNTPQGMNGPYDDAGNKIDKPVYVSLGPVEGGEVVLKGAISKTATIFQHASFVTTLRPDLQISALDNDESANKLLRKYGFDVCRATKIGNINTPSGATISTYKASGYSIFNGVENDKDKKDRVSLIAAAIAFPERGNGYLFMTGVVENDIKAYEENKKKYDDMAMQYFMAMFSGHSVDYKPVKIK